MKILIVDDDREIVHVLSAALWAVGWEPVVAVDATQALVLAHRAQPAAILLDVNMPGGTGVEALKRLKMSTKTSSIHVIVITASSDPELPEKMKSLGAEAFLTKPLDLDGLLQTLSGLVGHAGASSPNGSKRPASRAPSSGSGRVSR